MVFRTSLFREVGGYEPRLFIGGEEDLVALDVLATNQSIVYCEQLTVHHRPSPSRDSGLRRRTLARNTAWNAWLRLPWTQACRTTLRSLGLLAREGHLIRDGIGLLRGLTWVLPRRRVVPDAVLRLRERVFAGERALAVASATSDAKAAA